MTDTINTNSLSSTSINDTNNNKRKIEDHEDPLNKIQKVTDSSSSLTDKDKVIKHEGVDLKQDTIQSITTIDTTKLTIEKENNNNNNSIPTLSPQPPSPFDISTLFQGHPATAAALSSFLTEQQQHFLQTYVQATGQDLSQLTPSSLAQVMIAPISVPGLQILQQLQGNNIITALPGPPTELLNKSIHPTVSNTSPLIHPDIKSNEGNNNENENENNKKENQQNENKSSSSVSSSTSISTASNLHASILSPSTIPLPSSITSQSSNNEVATAAAAVAAAAARNMSNDERRQRRLLRNRIAAKECRKKKKQYIQDMEEKIAKLEKENELLKKQLDEVNNKFNLTVQGSESYRLMKEVEELNAKLGLGQLSNNNNTIQLKKDDNNDELLSPTLSTKENITKINDDSSNDIIINSITTPTTPTTTSIPLEDMNSNSSTLSSINDNDVKSIE